MTQLVSNPSHRIPERRAFARTSVARHSILRCDDGMTLPVQIADIARDGCALRIEGDLTPNQRVEIDIAGMGLVGGRIVWRSQASYGCRFDESLPAGAITRLFMTDEVPVAMTGALARRFSPAKVRPAMSLAILASVCVCGWAGVAGVVMQWA